MFCAQNVHPARAPGPKTAPLTAKHNGMEGRVRTCVNYGPITPTRPPADPRGTQEDETEVGRPGTPFTITPYPRPPPAWSPLPVATLPPTNPAQAGKVGVVPQGTDRPGSLYIKVRVPRLCRHYGTCPFLAQFHHAHPQRGPKLVMELCGHPGGRPPWQSWRLTSPNLSQPAGMAPVPSVPGRC